MSENKNKKMTEKEKIIRTYLTIRKQSNFVQSFYKEFLESVEKAGFVKVVKVIHEK
jgi:hypothetical protein